MARITLVISHLGLGGAERIICLMANYWAGAGYDVTLITLTHGTGPSLHPLEPGVNHVDVDFSSVRRRAWPKLRTLACFRALRRAIERSAPDVVISFLNTTNIFTLGATLFSRVPVIVSERVNQRFESLKPQWAALRAVLYRRAARIVVQTDDAVGFFGPSMANRISVIPNPVLPAPVGNVIAADARRRLVGLGRLAQQKRFDLLISAFEPLARERSQWDLEIWGDGPERQRLEGLVEERGLAGRVFLRGRTDDVFLALGRAQVFVLSSDYEGFPNALCEAMSAGLAVISTDCPSGPRDIVRPGIDGVLVPPNDVQALTASMRSLIDDQALRERLGHHARQLPSRFPLDGVMRQWGQLIDAATI